MTLKETVKWWGSALRGLYKKGVTAEIIVHKTTPQCYRELGRENKIIIYYLPQDLNTISNFAVANNLHIMDDDKVQFYNPWRARKKKKVFEILKEYSIRIPPSKIDAVFDMINAKKNPNKIYKFLENHLATA